MNLVLYAVPGFVVLMAVEFLYGLARGRNTYHLADTVNSLSLGTLSRLKGLLKLGMAGAVFDAVRDPLGLSPLPADRTWVWIAAFVGYDFCYYWSHRFGHQWRLLWASHVAHHQSEEFNLSTALRQTSTGTTFVFYLPLYLAGLPTEVVITVGSLNLIYQFWVHTEHVAALGPVEWLLVTPSNHRVHHARNPEYIDRNYGGVFIVWDRLFGTYKAERPESPCVYGITEPLASWNPLWANLHVWVQTTRDSLHTRRWRDKVRLWFSSPAWYPDDLSPTRHDWRRPKYRPEPVPGSAAIVFVQYWLVTVAGLGLVVLAADLPRALVLSALAILVFSLYALGTLLEGRRYGAAVELLRVLLVTLWAGYWAPTLGAPLTTALLGYAAASLLAAAWLFWWRPRRSGTLRHGPPFPS